MGRLLTPANFDGAAQPPPSKVVARKVCDTLPPERIKQYYPNGFPSNYDGKYTPIREDWHAGYPIAESQFGNQRFAEREAKTNQIFYSGIQGWSWNMEQAVPDRLPYSAANNVGVIGGERQQLRGSHLDRVGGDGKVRPRQLSPEEVDGMEEADTAEPLLRMALARLMSYKEEGAPKSPTEKSKTSTDNSKTSTDNSKTSTDNSKSSTENSKPPTERPWPNVFVKADDAWVDTLEEGYSSYFSKLGDESVKRKKAARKPRRGY